MHTTTPPPVGRLLSLQAVRAVAASLVVLVHLGGPTAFEHKVFGSSLLQPVWWPAQSGVDLFFVVSGFVMAVTAGGALFAGAPRPSVGRFAWRRASRVYPLYWAVSLVLLAVVLAAPGLVHGNGEETDLLATFALLPQRGEPLLLVGWTLVYEMGFYLVFTLSLLAGRRGRGAARAVLVAWAAAVLVAGPFVPQGASPWLQVATNPLNLEFGMGVLAGWLVVSGRAAGRGPLLLGAGLTVLLATWVDLSLRGPLTGTGLAMALALGGGSALTVTGLATLEREGRLRVPALLGRLGDASYSLYLVHVPVITLAAIVLARVLPDLRGPAGLALQAVVVVVAFVGCQVAGLLAHALLERPLLTLTRRLERRVASPRGAAARPAQARPERGEVSAAASTLTT
ncbi:acyltransferase family protein [Kineococcus sp. SYSU DK001]|uniref:acyltransferase family protein n=1 Tax=Kineococcus sp. SYSU DK001 TaxID=3383122 RepID=UPI003D7D4B08